MESQENAEISINGVAVDAGALRQAIEDIIDDRLDEATPTAAPPSDGGGVISRKSTLERFGSRNSMLHHVDYILRSMVVGQDAAVTDMLRVLTRAAAGLSKKDAPIATFLFSGPSGVGKTQMAKALAKALHGDANLLLRVDCSEFAEPHSVARLIGSPPGYVGSDLPVILSKEEVEKRAWNIILFDEIEKANPTVHNLLLHVLDEGKLSLARKTPDQPSDVDFSSTIIIMTSNVGSKKVNDILADTSIGFSGTTTNTKTSSVGNAVNKELLSIFSPEFMNRLKNIVVFNPLDESMASGVIDVAFDEAARRIKELLRIKVYATKQAKAFILKECYDPSVGARALVNGVERHVVDTIAEQVVSSEISDGDSVTLRQSNGALVLTKEKSASE